jgi:hypothetical protein
LQDAIEYGREIIPRVRAEIARRDAAANQGNIKTAKAG